MKKKVIKILVVFLIGSIFLLTGQNSEAKKKKPTSPKIVGSLKCNGSCHDPWYLAWSETPHARTYNLLKPGERDEAKKKRVLILKKTIREILPVFHVTLPVIKNREGSRDLIQSVPLKRMTRTSLIYPLWVVKCAMVL